MKLSELTNGSEAIIVDVKGQGAFRKRITEMGFVKGRKITAIKNAPLNDPKEYKIMDYYISLRREEAEWIEISSKSMELRSQESALNESPANPASHPSHSDKLIRVALVGNPNSGKTSLFNYISGSRERTGNYSGVTVDSKTSRLEHKGYTIEISDLPGTYSVTPYTPEELFVRQHLISQHPDVVVNIMDATNLERNLYLTTQLLDMGLKMVAALNMYDELQRSGNTVDHLHLGKMLGIPFVPTVGSRGRGINQLLDQIVEVATGQHPFSRNVSIHYGPAVETAIDQISAALKQGGLETTPVPTRYLAIQALEKDFEFVAGQIEKTNNPQLLEQAKAIVAKTDKQLGHDAETFLTDSRYGFIAGAIKETCDHKSTGVHNTSRQIDHWLTHKLFGIPIFIVFIWLMFEATFRLGQFPMDWIDGGVATLGTWMQNWFPQGPLKDLLIDGIISGVGGVVVFLPNILILFFFISFMEDTGYMARAAFIMDKLMHKMGLHGKSFIPLIMGFGCNVPAIMATRTIEDRNNRLLTMLINPFMSCSARLPVYILIAGAFFEENAGTVLFGMYLTGIAMAILISRLFKRFIFKGKELPFVMELPPYRLPTLRNTAKHMWHKGSQYLSKMGGTILVASILIWFLGYFPLDREKSTQFEEQIAQIDAQYSQQIAQEPELATQHTEEWETQRNHLTQLQNSAHQAESYIGRLGQSVQPIMAPLGFDWKMSVSLITGVAAKEVVVSTIAVLYQATDGDDSDEQRLIHRLQQEKKIDGTPAFTKSSALAFLMFVLIYFPCVAVIAAIRKESGSWKWALLTIGYTTLLAWAMALATHTLGNLIW